MSQQPTQTSTIHETSQRSATKSNARCTHATTTGRRCRLRVMDIPSGLCFRHFQLAYRAHPHVHAGQCSPVPDTVTAELLSEIENFQDANSINYFLGNVVRQLAHKRISRQDAIAYGYLSQLLLNTLRPLSIERDIADGEAMRLQILENVKGPRHRLRVEEESTGSEAAISPGTSDPATGNHQP